MQYGFFEILSLLGALGFFIYGMKVMSEGIQKVAGAKMRNILSSMTSNRIKGVFTGFTITSLVQSSSATTVLVVSFVNAGLLSLTESIGVIMGANIGTTITAWLISIFGFKVKIAAYALPIIAVGFPLMFFNKDKIKFWGEVLVGFALLFMGLSLLKDSVPDLNSNPEILAFLSNYTDLGFFSILIFVVIGTIITIVVQSSSAAMALTLVMANNGWIPFELAAAMVLGENIGTTITANLAALVGNVHAKRAALSHLIFNITGVIWILLIFSPVLTLVDKYLVASGADSPYLSAAAIPIGLSVFHSAFNIANTMIMIWFVDFIARTVTKLIKTTGDDEFHLEYISTGLMNTAELSIEEARKETVRMGELIGKMSKVYRELLIAEKPKKQQKLLKKMRLLEEQTDRMDYEISEYLVKVTSRGVLSPQSTIRVTELLSATNDLERIGDLFFQMSRDVDRSLKNEKPFKGKQIKNLLKMLDLIDKAMILMIGNLKTTNRKNISLDQSVKVESEINELRDILRIDQARDIERDKYDPKRDGIYKDLFHLSEKLGDHIINVSEAMTGILEKDIKDEIIE